MDKKRFFVIVLLTLGLLLALSGGLAAAQEGQPTRGGGDSGIQSPEAVEASSNYIPIQGRLTDASGNPLDGDYEVTFRIYDSTDGPALCERLTTVHVVAGLFSTYIQGSGCGIDGRALYMSIQVEDDAEMTPRLFIDNVPYAWTLRPGADVIAELGSNAILDIENWSASGRGLRSYAMSETGTNFGVVGASRSLDGYGGYFYNTNGGVGLYASSIDSGADLMLAGNADTTAGDDGVIASDPYYNSSDIVLETNDGLRIDLDHNGDGEDADFEIRDNANVLIFSVDESGAVTVRNSSNTVLFEIQSNGSVTFGGIGLSAFPRPAYDSGWQSLGLGATRDLTHNLGGSVDNYVVDMTCKSSSGLNNWGMGGDANWEEYYGAWWSHLTTTGIRLHRWNDDTDCAQMRVRIWMYP